MVNELIDAKPDETHFNLLRVACFLLSCDWCSPGAQFGGVQSETGDPDTEGAGQEVSQRPEPPGQTPEDSV